MANGKRLIDANQIVYHVSGFPKGDGQDSRLDWAFREEIDKLPTVDPVDCRCIDCKHYFHYGKTSIPVNGKNIKAGWCYRRIRYDEEFRMLPTDHCSYADRRDEK